MKSKEWHEERRKGIGGSDAAAILGLDPYRSPLQVYFEKRGELDPSSDNKHTLRGERLEPVIADLFSEETGYKLRRVRFSKAHPDRPWMRGNIDRMILSIDDRGPGVLEIKAPSMYAADTWKDGPPDSAYIQVMHYMEVFGWSWGYIAAWLGATDLMYYPVNRDEGLIAAMIEAESKFWHDHVLKGVPPEGRISESVLARLYPESQGTEITLPADMSLWLSQYHDAQVIVKQAEALQDEASEHIKLAMGTAEKGLYLGPDGAYAVSWKSSKPYLMWDRTEMEKDAELVRKYKTKEIIRRTFSVRRQGEKIGEEKHGKIGGKSGKI